MGGFFSKNPNFFASARQPAPFFGAKLMQIKQLIDCGLMDNTEMDRIPTKIKWKIQPLFTLYLKILKVTLIENCKMNHLIFYFLLSYTNLYISWHHFSQIFRTSLKIIWKIFVTNFSFLTDSLKPPPP